METSFLKHLAKQVLIFFVPVVVFAIIFWLFQLDFAIFRVAFMVISVFFLFYATYEMIYFKEAFKKDQEAKELKASLQEAVDEKRAYQADLEDYFFMWIHQIKTPITASYLLLEEPELKAKPLKQEIIRIENYTNMVLNYLKVQNPEKDMAISSVSLDQIISPLIQKYRYEFIHHNISLNYQPIVETVITEPNLTSIMVEQLLNNALKYAKGEKISIHFNPGKKVLTIEDTGIGIKKEDLPKIFDRGYSGFNGKLNQKSTGIGLYLVDKISKRLGHQVTIDSKFQQGTKAKIYFMSQKESNLTLL